MALLISQLALMFVVDGVAGVVDGAAHQLAGVLDGVACWRYIVV